MFILSTVSKGLEISLVNLTSINENSELRVFKNIKFLCEISNDWPHDLLQRNVYKTTESCW